MSFNDPFGRQAAKQARDYEAVRDALASAGVDSLESAEHCLANIRRNALVMVWLVMLSIMLAAILHPPVLPLVLVCSVVLLLWVAVSTQRGRTHLLRYMAEELGAETSRKPVDASARESVTPD